MAFMWDSFIGRTSLGSNWTSQAGAAQIFDTDRVSSNSNATDVCFRYNVTQPANTQEASAVLERVDSARGGVAARIGTSGLNAYSWIASTSAPKLELGKYVGGVFTSLATNTTTSVAGDKLTIKCNGTTISGWLNDVQIVSVTDSAHTAGYVGVAFYAASANSAATSVTFWNGGDLGDSLPALWPLDMTSNVRVVISKRRLLSTYTGPALRVTRLSDSTTQDINFLSDGELDTASYLSFVGAGDAIDQPYEQVTGTLMTVPNAFAPYGYISGAFIASPSGKPGLYFNGAHMLKHALANTISSATMTVHAVLSMNSATPAYGPLVNGYSSSATDDYDIPGAARFVCRDNTNDGIGMYRNGVGDASAITLATAYQMVSQFDGTNHTTYIDGVANTPAGSTGTFAIDNVLLAEAWVGNAYYNYFYYGNLWELVMCGNSQTSAVRTAQINDQTAYWIAPPDPYPQRWAYRQLAARWRG